MVGKQPWYIKLHGHADVVKRERDRLKEFVRTLKIAA